MQVIIVACQIAAVLSALGAAWLWYQSARTKAPPAGMNSYIGRTPMDEWLESSVINNRRAAAFALVSAVFGVVLR